MDQLDPNHREEIEDLAIDNEEYLDLPEEERESVMEYNESISEMYRSVAAAEQAASWRVLFQRAPEETLPFIIYCVYVSANSLAVLLTLTGNDGNNLPFFILVGLAMVLPLLTQPIGQYRTVFSWFQEVVYRKLSG